MSGQIVKRKINSLKTKTLPQLNLAITPTKQTIK